MHIDEILFMPSPAKLNEQTWIYSDKYIPSIWSQGRTAYGGVSSGMVFAAMQKHVGIGDLLRSYTTNFVGPIELDMSLAIYIEVLRKGKNVTQILGRIVQNDKTCVLCQGVFGQARDSKIEIQNNVPHAMKKPEKAKFIPQIPKVTPKFFRHFELSIEKGGLPFTRQKTSCYQGWMRYKKEPQTFSIAHLIAIIDAWPPAPLQMLKWPAPASTVSWHIDMLQPAVRVSSIDWLGYQASTKQANDGYGHTEAVIYSPDNQAIALSRQTVAVFG